MNRTRGQISLQVIIFAAVAVVVLSGFVFLAVSFLKLSVRSLNKASAFTIAEAGIEYYRWHLAHAPADYQDGTGGPGPYVHNYFDRLGVNIGTFTLEITAPPLGSTIVTVKSTGRVIADSSVAKAIKVRMGIPSFAKYSIVVNANNRFGGGTEVFGEVHSNGGIRFDGFAHNLVTSALASYNDTDGDACTVNSLGVHTCVAPADPSPPASAPNRPDVFAVGRNFPVPAVDFDGLKQDLSQMKADAIMSGFYRPSSTALGYEVVLKTDDTFDLYRVTGLVPPPFGCNNLLGQSGWGTWSVQNRALLGNNPIPASGIIFLEDHAWVRGQVSTARLTIGSGTFPDNPSTRTSISVTNDILYTNYDGSDVISLVAQNNINIGMTSEADLRIDAALVAQNGRVGRYYYRPPTSIPRCSPHHTKTIITSFGMIASNIRYGFAYTDGTGYLTRNLVYDGNLLYSPPPSFPLTSEQYTLLSWEEVQ
ncbi:MAG: hypothetical protein HY435_01980 [Candidatus Liptonbacteria bacterium]|nr:hypothetical protein [Candidatus Liptonbacteria bacterium]